MGEIKREGTIPLASGRRPSVKFRVNEKLKRVEEPSEVRWDCADRSVRGHAYGPAAPISLRLALLALTVICAPRAVRGRSAETKWPDGVCGSPQTMLQAAQLGDAMARRALAASMAWSGKALNEYINRLGQNLARSSGSEQVFAFYVVYDPVVNAESFPGGYIVINSGAISLAESEAELASVLSHEIAHENSCDWLPAPAKGHLIEIMVLVPTVMLGGPVGIALTSGSGWAHTVTRARFSRFKERRADRLAAEYLGRAGYDPQAAVQFFQRVEAQNARRKPGGLRATHPRSGDRRRDLQKILPMLPPPEIVLHDDAEFLRMRQAVRAYDEIYARAVGARAPAEDAAPPVLSRRPAAGNEGPGR